MARFETLQAWLNWQEQLHPKSIDLGLARVAGVYARLRSDRPAPLTVTVAGTNGKGSCVAFLEAIYRAQGYKVGAYTSPHILRYNERIRIAGRSAGDAEICDAFARIDAARGETSLSYFEFGTLAALDLFARADVDVQLLEVGLGGRLDAVNIVDPDATLVTTIALDHVDWLGNTVEAIAREKAGIFRPGVPAVIGDQQPPASLLATAADIGAVTLRIGAAYRYRKRGEVWDWLGESAELLGLPVPALQGEHQYRNASAVIAAVQASNGRLPVGAEAIRRGVAEARLNGRFQLIDGSHPVLLDVGHNPQAVGTLLEYLSESFPNAKIRAVFAMMKDKDIAGVIRIMADRVAEWHLAPLANPRAAPPETIAALFPPELRDRVRDGYPDFSAAYRAASGQAGPGELTLIFGSFFLVSEYLSNFPRGA
ncbi:bifunctional tetrahydrofolate synthase/dihydrofolate synthase [Methylomonas sp. UP202]|uniref:bifunctional tetrahydrofolate synthase/dihydrofolate synthase n=1 Tax=Methylomonas sp. UP202 TaxID=3040943 RepID=UPI00143B0C4E|nr:bifunctional tetrahydrofolate synthase/dihydrofolate synthase [Methylomonas sp. UP202]NJA08524.1 bifunctional tetrahydrofolate synthase/dihydrofolate synthase [Methylococcaceae bacterium WWC4]WGS87398.1 bifunctional tetrahydrofolate synthase/dihydrofolate synthase [Methylomonas sp. UP202]